MEIDTIHRISCRMNGTLPWPAVITSAGKNGRSSKGTIFTIIVVILSSKWPKRSLPKHSRKHTKRERNLSSRLCTS